MRGDRAEAVARKSCSSMLSRREFLRAATLGSAGILLGAGDFAGAQGSAPVLAQDTDWFLCSTPQITNLPSIRNLANTGRRGSVRPLGNTGDGRTGTDLYGTARRALRWQKTDGALSTQGHLILKIGFVDGNAWQKSAVQFWCRSWQNIGLPLELVFSQDRPHIRISFEGTNYSEIGRNARRIAPGSATMRLVSCQRGASDAAVRRVVLHEFGHGICALGHEHKHPASGFQWNLEAIERDLGWTRAEVVKNITSVYDRSIACAGAPNYDPDSIMHYPIKAGWVRGGRSAPFTSMLSIGDIHCAESVYRNWR